MGKNKEYAQRLKEMGYERKIIAFKLFDEVPENAEPYGDDVSFLCAIAAETWKEARKPFYVTNMNVLCGGALYSGISPYFFKHHKYLVIGVLEEVEDPDVLMVVADAYKVMRLHKAYTWKTGKLVQGLSGTAMFTNSFSLVYRTKTMTYNMEDEQSRRLMNLEPGEMYGIIHYDLLSLIVENLGNIQTGLAMRLLNNRQLHYLRYVLGCLPDKLCRGV